MRVVNKFIRCFVKFPLYEDDGKSFSILKPIIKDALDCVNVKIKNGEYKHIKNPCLCGNESENQDCVISKKDMWGIAVESVICSKCGLIRSKEILNDASFIDFYEKHYKNIYHNSIEPNESLFMGQTSRGQGFFELLQSLGFLDQIETVFDYGCDMGGVLVPFAKVGKKVTGCGFGKTYVSYGREKGLTGLYHGRLDFTKTEEASQDLVILSHVMEHFTKPIEQMQELLPIIKPGKYLLIEVPGLYADNPYKYYPVWHLQKGHVFNFFYKDFLKIFFQRLRLEVIFCNERCTFVLKKPFDYHPPVKVGPIFSPVLEKYPEEVGIYFKDSYIKYDFFKIFNRQRLIKFILPIVDALKMRRLLGLMVKESRDWIS